jgi:hypothetical protein
MNYLDSIVNPLFKKSESGSTLFYPWGILGKGYAVRSESEESHIRSLLKVYYLLFLVAMIFCFYVLGWQYAVFCAVLGLGWYAIWSAKVTRPLSASDEKLKYSESVSQGLPYYSTWVLVVLSLFSLIMFLVCAIILYADPSEWIMGLLGLVLFGVTTVMLVFNIRLKLRVNRQ